MKRFRGEWLPSVAERWPLTDDPLVRILHDPERMLLPELEPYPAHFHIDLLPSHQGQGYGRALIGRFFGALEAQDVPAVHLGLTPPLADVTVPEWITSTSWWWGPGSAVASARCG
ncbi:hypothetical protein [Cryptosporangium phraense]|uniref:GNAT family N-acetyltransferase n=1 Tax=Cryptosporangium phraense TaxID=2593070 RepID=A0A545AYL5_9ACTN|nr:hypothetical protein [Cryptosporangium phraense]TQS46423.1 hypothetical protein FL583_03250 [Cryptosporangium phraense]